MTLRPQSSRSTLAVLALSIVFSLPIGLPPAAWSQAVAIAEISGTVSDPSGAAVVGAQVQVTETQKNTVRAAVTDTQGKYTLPNLPVGPYQMEVRASGFKEYVQSGMVLQVGNNVQVNVSLQIGSVNETVEVKSSVSLVETKENSISLVIDQSGINDLPLNG